MILTALVSNRTLSFALFCDGDVKGDASPLSTVRIAAQPARTSDEYAALLSMMLSQRVAPADVKISIIASVVPSLTDVVARAIRQLYENAVCLTVGAGLRTGFTIRTDAPSELGADMVALTSGALTLCEPPFLLMDCGAVTTVSAIGVGKSAPEFLGCAILPGPTLCADALKLYAAQLPNVSLKKPERAIGTNTGDSMRAGLMLGYRAALLGLVDAFSAEMNAKDLRLIVTGEDAERIGIPDSLTAQFDADLAHRGLCRLARMNARKSGNPPKRG